MKYSTPKTTVVGQASKLIQLKTIKPTDGQQQLRVAALSNLLDAD